jgi:addiction module HigA family antidote
MHNPPHPGEFIESIYMEPYDISCRYLAGQLGVAASTLNRVIKGKSAVSPEMALRLSKVLDRTPQSWLAMQDNYEIWQTQKRVNLSELQPLKFLTA